MCRLCAGGQVSVGPFVLPSLLCSSVCDASLVVVKGGPEKAVRGVLRAVEAREVARTVSEAFSAWRVQGTSVRFCRLLLHSCKGQHGHLLECATSGM